MIRGQRFFSLAVRRLDGSIYRTAEPLSQMYTGKLRRIPLLRGIVVLIETLVLGIKVLTRSANIAMEDQTQGEQKEMSNWVVFLSLGVSMLIGVGIFFLLPLFAARSLDLWIEPGRWGDFASNFLEGLLRLGLLVGYISVIGMMKDIRRVFAYHGAEHMTIHAYERGLPLEVPNIRPFSTAHPRCGTAFLLTVAVVAVFIFAILGRPISSGPFSPGYYSYRSLRESATRLFDLAGCTRATCSRPFWPPPEWPCSGSLPAVLMTTRLRWPFTP